MSMNNITHQELVRRLFKPGGEIYKHLDPHRSELLHAVIGISTEAGELLDCVKKHVMYNQTLDIANFSEELGDIEFYLEAARQVTLVNRETTLNVNILKLIQRYGDRYSDAAAKERKDKQL